MAGIYIHIPFCKQACHYCNFHFSTSLRYKNELIDALLKEIAITPLASPENIETIYFGGGTPSICTPEELASILSAVRDRFTVLPGAEVTLEANPDDINAEQLESWKSIGINRLSIGVQSFFEEDLVWMNRAHTAVQAMAQLELATRHFENITIDLIYGSPGLTDKKWKENVDRALSLGIPHLSCYALTVEPKTPLQKMIRQHLSPDVNPDQQSSQFLLLMEWMREAGYEHYEISNFAKPGFRSRHNSSYWQGKKYWGFGPSAHSFDGKHRWWNIANNASYIRSISENNIPAEKETLTPNQQWNESVMISLRTMEGIDRATLPARHENLGTRELEMALMELDNKSRKYTEEGLMRVQGTLLQLTDKGKLYADGIAADLFLL